MKNKILIIGALLTFLFSSCNIQELEKYNPEFKGEWRSTVYYYAIAGDSTRNYLTVDGRESGFGMACDKDNVYTDCIFFEAGKIKYNKASKAIQIGSTVNQIHYIDKEPFFNNGKWEIIIDSISYYKY